MCVSLNRLELILANEPSRINQRVKTYWLAAALQYLIEMQGQIKQEA